MINAAFPNTLTPPTPAAAPPATAAPTLAFTSLFAALPVATIEPPTIGVAAMIEPPRASIEEASSPALPMPLRQSDAESGMPLPPDHAAPLVALADASRATAAAPVEPDQPVPDPADQPRRTMTRLAITSTALTPLKFVPARATVTTEKTLDAEAETDPDTPVVDPVPTDRPAPIVLAVPLPITLPTPVTTPVKTPAATPGGSSTQTVGVTPAPQPPASPMLARQPLAPAAAPTPIATPDPATSAPASTPTPAPTEQLSIDAPRRPRIETETAIPLARTDVALAPQPVTTGPAMQVFASAIVAASRRDHVRDAAPTPDAAPSALSTVSVAVPQLAAAPDAQQGTLDMSDSRWPHAMIDRIEQLRDTANANDTRIRLVPDALGSIDVSVKRDGDTIHVHFATEQAATRVLIQEAQPRLAAVAQERGLSLGQTSVGADTGQGQAWHQQRQPQPVASLAAAPARTEPTDTLDAAMSGRLA